MTAQKFRVFPCVNSFKALPASPAKEIVQRTQVRQLRQRGSVNACGAIVGQPFAALINPRHVQQTNTKEIGN